MSTIPRRRSAPAATAQHDLRQNRTGAKITGSPILASEAVSLLSRGPRGVAQWNKWRKNFGNEEPPVDLSGVCLDKASLREASFFNTTLTGVRLAHADLYKANLNRAKLNGASLRYADLTKASLNMAQLRGADLTGADLYGTNLRLTDFTEANLTGASLRHASLARAKLNGAKLDGCSVYGTSVWDVKLAGASQKGLVITPPGEAAITVDNLKVAQFIYLMLENPEIRDAIDTIGKKAILILGRFTDERKTVLDAVRDKLRKRNYLPILFDFEGPTSQNTTATVLTLARLARLIIADLTDPSSIPYELGRIVPNTKVPVQPLLLSSRREFAMFPDLQDDYH